MKQRLKFLLAIAIACWMLLLVTTPSTALATTKLSVEAQDAGPGDDPDDGSHQQESDERTQESDKFSDLVNKNEIPVDLTKLEEMMAEFHGFDLSGKFEHQFSTPLSGAGFSSSSEVKPGSSYHECGSFYIDEVGYTHNFDDTGYTRIHVVPTRRLKYATPAHLYGFAYNALVNCIKTHGPSVTVKSWATIQQQFLCHAAGRGIGAGPTWDLEGHRKSTWNVWTWVWTRCNW